MPTVLWVLAWPHTPGLDVQGHDRLGDRLGLVLLLLLVLSQALLAEGRSLGILLLVVAAKQIDIVVVLGSRGLGGVQGSGDLLRAVLGVGLGRIARER